MAGQPLLQVEGVETYYGNIRGKLKPQAPAAQ